MKAQSLKIGFVPTRRKIFSREEAGRVKRLVYDKVSSWGVNLVDIDWLNDEGLLYDISQAEHIAKRFTEEEVDAIFCPHVNFGTEDAVAKVGKLVNKPLLLWGPRDESPLPDGSRLRDTQCGMFATSRVLQRFGVPFTYVTNSWIDSPTFEKGFKNFMGASAVVKAFQKLRIGQIDTRPGAFWSVISNEGELVEKFGVETVPVSVADIGKWTNDILSSHPAELDECTTDIRSRVKLVDVDEDGVKRVAAMKVALQRWVEENSLDGIAIQCWSALQGVLGVQACFLCGELTDMGVPMVCETDIHGAITAIILQAARMWETPIFFADLTIRHPENENGELLWHCGCFPYSLKAEDCEAVLSGSAVGCPGIGNWEIKGGDITVARFDGGSGEYLLLMGHAKGIKGPRNNGTYLWVEVEDWPLWEHKLMYGPYIHHVAGVHGSVAPVLYEACRYIPDLKPDPVTPTAEEIERSLRE
jgi:L-fucose isomerase-like protein